MVVRWTSSSDGRLLRKRFIVRPGWYARSWGRALEWKKALG